MAHSINDSVENGIADAKEALHKEDEEVRLAYRESYQNALHHYTDPGFQNIIVHLDSMVVAGARFMDSISGVDSLKLTVLNQPTADAWKEHYFTILNPFTAMALLHGFTYEVFQVSKACLPGT